MSKPKKDINTIATEFLDKLPTIIPSSRTRKKDNLYPFLFLRDEQMKSIEPLPGEFIWKHTDDSAVPYSIVHSAALAISRLERGSMSWLRVFCECAWCYENSRNGLGNSFDVIEHLFQVVIPATVLVEEEWFEAEGCFILPPPMLETPVGVEEPTTYSSGRYSIVVPKEERKEESPTGDVIHREVIDERLLETMLKGKKR